MGDPLIAIYLSSFQQKQPGRLASQPLPSSELQKVSEEIQSTGKSPRDPPPNSLPPEKLPAPDDWIVPPPPRPPKINEPGRLVRKIEETAKPFLDELWNQQKREYELLFKFYNDLVIKEFEEIRAFTGAKMEIFKSLVQQGKYRNLEPLPYYKFLRPIWYKNKIREPVAFMNTLLFSGVKFAGKPVLQGVHPKFADMLQSVEKTIADVTELLKKKPVSNPTMKPIAYIGCFRPDPVKDRLSNHMIGAAIDIDSGNNPFLQVAEIRALDNMLTFVAKEEAKANLPTEKLRLEISWLGGPMNFQSADDLETARRKYIYTVKISEKTIKFLHDFFPEWQESREKKKPLPTDLTKAEAFVIIDQLVYAFGKGKVRNGIEKLTNIERQGLISIPAEVFIALDSDPNIEWLQWGFEGLEGTKPAKRSFGIDIMHFQVADRDAFIGSGLP